MDLQIYSLGSAATVERVTRPVEQFEIPRQRRGRTCSAPVPATPVDGGTSDTRVEKLCELLEWDTVLYSTLKLFPAQVQSAAVRHPRLTGGPARVLRHALALPALSYLELTGVLSAALRAEQAEAGDGAVDVAPGTLKAVLFWPTPIRQEAAAKLLHGYADPKKWKRSSLAVLPDVVAHLNSSRFYALTAALAGAARTGEDVSEVLNQLEKEGEEVQETFCSYMEGGTGVAESLWRAQLSVARISR